MCGVGVVRAVVDVAADGVEVDVVRRVGRTRIAKVADPVEIGVGLRRVGKERTVVAAVPAAVAVNVRLGGVGNALAVVLRVDDAVAIEVDIVLDRAGKSVRPVRHDEKVTVFGCGVVRERRAGGNPDLREGRVDGKLPDPGRRARAGSGEDPVPRRSRIQARIDGLRPRQVDAVAHAETDLQIARGLEHVAAERRHERHRIRRREDVVHRGAAVGPREPSVRMAVLFELRARGSDVALQAGDAGHDHRRADGLGIERQSEIGSRRADEAEVAQFG